MKDAGAEWAGEKGRFWAEHADWFSGLPADFLDPVLETAALVPGERVLDVGCGGGDLSMAAAAVVGPSGSVLGVDLSADELDVARVRAAQRGVDNVGDVGEPVAVGTLQFEAPTPDPECGASIGRQNESRSQPVGFGPPTGPACPRRRSARPHGPVVASVSVPCPGTAQVSRSSSGMPGVLSRS